MKVLVTGATSGLGRNAAQWLLEAGHQVRATGRDRHAGEALRQLGAEFSPLDLAEATAEQCRQLVNGCDWVWHCAAKSAPWGSKAEFYQANVAATEKLAEAAGRCGVRRFVHISTPAVYFDFRPHQDIEETYRARRFANHYAASKYAAEQQLRARVPRYPQTAYVILRPRGLFGPHDRVIVPRLLRQLDRDRGVLRLPGGGKALLDLTFVLNVVHAMDLASRQRQLPSGAAYNITNHQPQRLADMLDSLLRGQLGLRYRLQAVPYPLLHLLAGGLELAARFTGKEPLLTRYSVAAVHYDMTLSRVRAVEELGYRPRYSMEEGIHLTGEWLNLQGGVAHG
ncbi:NAD-dependent epimerase/dehydratase family protein [Serratia entomophila]|uniref:NAD-dependent epimerase/dehydratase family protein n=1 Tax=Serratia entomophila TaxID=42906 RepID=UPI00217958B9|nr:SDR family NAD(P)-dependent oxidoreductase [Serratia entomophila]CAI0744385.1 Cholesterol dehydrogenase [Serratia entomophila]CAI1501303.1 Cholesterol dehydrogenase [Serratia entomophila]CAI1507264.1 Cholesterol dehydrogenase [Serratia entomophila]CAI1530485.1 Cholesterol dehydrogenase [Serratia entomophila]CAI1643534.1 Cholesterol dehydrogenase [Serratia entomophila]